MPARSRDLQALRVFASEHARAHARLATLRPNAACACGATGCRHHTARATCTGRTLLVLIHNPLLAEVWTLAEICQACAPLISHATVLAGAGPAGGHESLAARAAAAAAAAANGGTAATGGTGAPGAPPAASPGAPATPPAVPMMFSSPEAAGGPGVPQPNRRRPRRDGGGQGGGRGGARGGGRGGQGGQGGNRPGRGHS
ncbi:hypothetical protein ACGF1Z_01395 [Streptomyces sp. NPDC048018]|uniref:hypothetical protein n=1 Tax=Streptomyces sp. NPDC048018 TaxID=3365499 RepID=UPI00372262F1